MEQFVDRGGDVDIQRPDYRIRQNSGIKKEEGFEVGYEIANTKMTDP